MFTTSLSLEKQIHALVYNGAIDKFPLYRLTFFLSNSSRKHKSSTLCLHILYFVWVFTFLIGAYEIVWYDISLTRRRRYLGKRIRKQVFSFEDEKKPTDESIMSSKQNQVFFTIMSWKQHETYPAQKLLLPWTWGWIY